MVHSHPDGRGWQELNKTDFATEHTLLARQTFGVTGHPLVGLTLSGDRIWSARIYPKLVEVGVGYEPCTSVRVVGKRLRVSYNPSRLPPPKIGDALTRTTSVWGNSAQQDLMRLRVGVIGLGSVGMVVVESLSRMGVIDLRGLDFDIVENHNRDRLLGATKEDSRAGLKKTLLAKRNAEAAFTADGAEFSDFDASIVEEAGYRTALDCDVLFSCAEGNWPKQVLNHLAYANLIPVLDGGVNFKIDERSQLRHGGFRAATLGPGHICGECIPMYRTDRIQLERDGHIFRKEYIEKLSPEMQEDLRQERFNVFPFAASLASIEVMQFAEMVTGLANKWDFGVQQFEYKNGELQKVPTLTKCGLGCPFPGIVAQGDASTPVLGTDRLKEKLNRELAKSRPSRRRHCQTVMKFRLNRRKTVSRGVVP